jgi:hypothetical protein
VSVTYRTLPWRRADGWALLAIACVFFACIFVLPKQALAGILGVILALGVEAVVVWRSVLTVTPDELTYLDMIGPVAHAPRERIKSIRIFSYWTCALDDDGNTLLRIRGGFTRGQLLNLAELLSVPLYDNRKWLGLSHSNQGTEVTRAD